MPVLCSKIHSPEQLFLYTTLGMVSESVRGRLPHHCTYGQHMCNDEICGPLSGEPCLIKQQVQPLQRPLQ